MDLDSISSFLGLIKKAGRVDVGEEPVGAACRAGKAYLVLTANDAAPNSIRRALHFAEARQVPVFPVPFDKDQLGRAIGRPPCAMISISDVGFAAALAKKLAATDSGLNAELVSKLDQKSVKAIQRRNETRAHKKNLLRGKKKPRLSTLEGKQKP